ncbi:rRNA maturation RNase YbeY [Pediococcus pentosaceus]|jgi:probable rRNA maturation factor|uniref:Endoribonuclease YbeY n=3 Tax=Pediococcus pentosaceus TaxID=1255 RepID=YBEY_PEDPA|nr:MULTISPECIES: rRNA maturation RNase YbeY [Pediococcus]Q03F61.1 RecName: Full=Endoribonuclease YbeY [Pediococcus pentosaceus ATCC 25745]ABJ68161.1 Predicted metal-dependent hydrolase [Pediococcus pentosaceus ATCC 25745]AHA05203.1 rRNA maturation factor [Pediococcus pentosaceus SL4]ANI97809.1 rRNA maturation RNase YbeY [Pediococcus pentosaceus]ASC08327.1 Endoribonuclease YbeY [Pediococcus pentosaceus]AVL01607.1 endoribonuclease YbeY [Pediococcus pentosaceus]
MDIQTFDHTKEENPKNLELITDILEFAGNYLHLDEETEISVTLMHNDEIHQINKEYRNVDRPTDVISFAINDADEDIIMDPEMAEEIPANIGDLMISVDKVAEQAEFLGHSYERELGFLCVHGFLHLNGYDHMEKEDQEKMFPLQKEIMNAYGLKR